MMDDTLLTPRRPYLLRAFYDWLVDNDCTPHLVVDATMPHVEVPQQYVQDGQIVLNVAPEAVVELELDNDNVQFSARFGGQPITIVVPIYAVMAIYGRENGAGTMFEPEPAYVELLKNIESTVDGVNTPATIAAAVSPVLEVPEEGYVSELLDDDIFENAIDASSATDVDDPNSSKKRPKGPPTLTVVK